MAILVINCGSSSIKAAVVDPTTGSALVGVEAERVGTDTPRLTWTGVDLAVPVAGDHAAVLAVALPALVEHMPPGVTLEGIGHRVVHGGERFTQPTLIEAEVEAGIKALIPLAPLHNPANLAGIRAARHHLPHLPQVAIFDTAFHGHLPRRARTYAIPQDIAQKHGLRRYGFHGTSHAYVARKAAAWLQADLSTLRVITCHLGNGASVCAVEYGVSVETSMGLTPLEGLVMGTRCGDVDAGLLIALARAENLSLDQLDTLLNQQSGLTGLAGQRDMRDLEARAASGDADAQLAIHVFVHRLRKYIGAYAAVMGGLDALVFTAGIGENSAPIRHQVTQRMQWLGIHLDEEKNQARAHGGSPVVDLSAPHGRVRVLAIHTDEQHAIASETANHLAKLAPQDAGRIPVAVSARHIHLTQEAVEILFGAGHQLTPRNPLSQPGQYACEETLTVVGPRKNLEKVRVLGPTRPACQVEVSRTDEFWLGIDAPVRLSGQTQGSAPITLQGPAGSLALTEGLICARRHIHMTPADATRFGVANGDEVDVLLDTDGRDLIFRDVSIRVSKDFRLEMHIDTDEANAADLKPGAEGMLVGTDGSVRLVRR